MLKLLIQISDRYPILFVFDNIGYTPFQYQLKLFDENEINQSYGFIHYTLSDNIST